MTRKKKEDAGKPTRVAPGAVKSTAEQTLEYWTEENMRKAKPISIEIASRDDKSGGPEEK